MHLSHFHLKQIPLFTTEHSPPHVPYTPGSHSLFPNVQCSLFHGHLYAQSCWRKKICSPFSWWITLLTGLNFHFPQDPPPWHLLPSRVELSVNLLFISLNTIFQPSAWHIHLLNLKLHFIQGNSMTCLQYPSPLWKTVALSLCLLLFTPSVSKTVIFVSWNCGEDQWDILQQTHVHHRQALEVVTMSGWQLCPQPSLGKHNLLTKISECEK